MEHPKVLCLVLFASIAGFGLASEDARYGHSRAEIEQIMRRSTEKLQADGSTATASVDVDFPNRLQTHQKDMSKTSLGPVN